MLNVKDSRKFLQISTASFSTEPVGFMGVETEENHSGVSPMEQYENKGGRNTEKETESQTLHLNTPTVIPVQNNFRLLV